VQFLARTGWIAAVLALGACAMPDMDSFKTPDKSIFAPRSVSAVRQTQLRPVTAEDLVDSQGRCAGALASADPGGDPGTAPANVPAMPAGIGLDMTECDVVKRAGHPERVELGTNERSERTAILTYIQGPRPGIYYFTAGRLTSMERAPEPPKPVKPAKPAPKPKRAAT
jgi:hypothetical protein